MMLQGVQVNPLEWWDPRWVDQHILVKVKVATEEEGEDDETAKEAGDVADLLDPA